MKDTDLEFFRHLLTDWMEDLLAHTDNSVESLLDPRETLPDPLDSSSAESDRAWTLRIRDRESMLIKRIRNSLEAIERNEYGICEDCGEDISIERLKARPVTSFYPAKPKENPMKNLLEYDTGWQMNLPKTLSDCKDISFYVINQN